LDEIASVHFYKWFLLSNYGSITSNTIVGGNRGGLEKGAQTPKFK